MIFVDTGPFVANQRVGYCDCVSFAIMRRLRLCDAFAFDLHFEQAGFVLWPDAR